MNIFVDKTRKEYTCKYCESILFTNFNDLEIMYGYKTEDNVTKTCLDSITLICPCCNSRNDVFTEYKDICEKICLHNNEKH
ncbi:MAG: hypothetical protein RSE41_01170 [Clostridia bacterium]